MPTVAADASGIYAVTLEDYRGNVSETVVFSVKDGAIEEFDKTELLALIAEAEKVDTSLYTEETVAVFTAALAEAQTVADTFYAMPEDIQAAYDALDAAMKGLELLPEEPESSEGSDTSEDSESSEDSNSSQEPGQSEGSTSSEEPGDNAQTGHSFFPAAVALVVLLAAGCGLVVVKKQKQETL